MQDIKVMDTLKELENDSYATKIFHPIAFFAQTLGIVKDDMSIEDMAKCFKAQFKEEELSKLIHYLNI